MVVISLTEDQAYQVLHSMEWAKMMDSHEDNPDKNFPQPDMREVARHRGEIQKLLDVIHYEIKQQLNGN